MQKYTSSVCVLRQIIRKICSDAYAHAKITFCSVCIVLQFTRKICPNAYAHAKIYFFSVGVCVAVYSFAVHTRNLPKSLRACKNNIFQCVYFGKSHTKLALMLTRMQKIYFFRCVYLQKSQVTFALTNTFFSTHTAQHTQVGNSPSMPYKGSTKGFEPIPIPMPCAHAQVQKSPSIPYSGNSPM